MKPSTIYVPEERTYTFNVDDFVHVIKAVIIKVLFFKLKKKNNLHDDVGRQLSWMLQIVVFIACMILLHVTKR